MMRPLVLVALLLPFLAGCVSAVELRAPRAGAVARCGPYSALACLGPTAAWNRDGSERVESCQARCAAAYEGRGYMLASR